MRIQNTNLQSIASGNLNPAHARRDESQTVTTTQNRNFDSIRITPESERNTAKNAPNTYQPSSELQPVHIKEFLFDPSVKRAGDYAIIHSPMDKWLDQDSGDMSALMRKQIETLLPNEKVFKMNVTNGISNIDK